MAKEKAKDVEKGMFHAITGMGATMVITTTVGYVPMHTGGQGGSCIMILAIPPHYVCPILHIHNGGILPKCVSAHFIIVATDAFCESSKSYQ